MKVLHVHAGIIGYSSREQPFGLEWRYINRLQRLPRTSGPQGLAGK